ncbi:PAS domain S-box protein [Paenibacillus chartarius]|uniref:PAS domain S-box protein n=1 Tax=Paenibacillus chartarius TaxID=747481 RepID=A0ABV6DM27_9BACL
MPLSRLSTRGILDHIFQYSPIGMALVALDGSFLKVNSALCDITGYAEQELTTLCFQDITLEEDLPESVRVIDCLLNRGDNSVELTKRYFHKAGHRVTVRIHTSVVRDPDSNSPILLVAQILKLPEASC